MKLFPREAAADQRLLEHRRPPTWSLSGRNPRQRNAQKTIQSGAIQPLRPVDPRGALFALLVSLLWGANPVVIKLGLLDAPPLRLAGLRMVLGGATICLWAWATGRLAGLRVGPGEWRPLGYLGVLFAVQVGATHVGTALTSAAHSAILLNLYAVHTVVLAHFQIPGDRLTTRKLAGVLVAYAGIVLLFARQVTLGAPTLLGDVIMFVAALLLGERTVYLARAVQRLDAVKLLLAQAVVGIALFFLVSALFEPAATRWTWRLAGSVAYQGILIAGFNFVVNLWLLRHYRASALAGFFLTQPLFGVLIAALVTGDPLTPELLIASAAVAVGIGLTSR
ncbi:MAG: DMT family transporter [Candidatus Rokubacteria bacterium]|nr:DMT family transporter [Candidatus Rokubacteria bacterium]MBI2016242.1 DMT family transporter [Candidatus Rokubacteria bacterium]MBI2157923.1 DMT family transporter [Candidatus Rokubacteria bacterium]MBI2493392.1 DMT family transporter [Candidatus Rokubacteria bacterium]MBI4255973.1 DMT family transporter [Candidatus Rokubacteria bacterium]